MAGRGPYAVHVVMAVVLLGCVVLVAHDPVIPGRCATGLAGLAPRAFRATLQATFLLQATVASVGFAVVGRMDRSVGLLALVGVAGSIMGWHYGDLLIRRVSAATLRVLLLWGLVATAVLVIGRALLQA